MTQFADDFEITQEQVDAINARIAAGEEYAELYGDINEHRAEPTGEEAPTMQTTTTNAAEAMANIDRLAAYQEKYPEIYHQWYRKLLNEPIDMAQRVYARLLHGAGTDGIAIKNAHKPIWMRETMPTDQPETAWMILAAADRQFEYDWMGQLA